jgi:hypothetical protein
VKSLAGLDCVLQTDLKGTINLVGPKGAAMQQKGHRVSLKIPKGATVVLYVGQKPNKFEIKPDLQALQAQKSWGIQ